MKTNMIQPKHVAYFVGMLLFAQLYHSTAVWFETHTLQSPIVLQKPWRDRFISPVPTDITVTPLVSPKKVTVSPKVTPSITPKKKAQIGDLVSNVEASEIASPTDEQIIAYIRSKDWDDDVAVALAKSENFWNLTKSFNCSRMGGLNKNGTRDHGLWQINDIHIKSGAITLDGANDCFKATDFAYGLYKGRGDTFTAWSAFTNGSYKSHL